MKKILILILNYKTWEATLDIIEKIHILADEDDRSVSQYINQVLRRHLEQKEE